MEIRFDGRVALITGAASGIGLEVAQGLARAGAVVGLLDLPGPGLDSAARGLGDDAGVVPLPSDVTSIAAVQAAVRKLAADAGGLDIVVTCAGRAITGPFAESDPSSWHSLLQVNLLGTMNACYAAIPYLVERGRGRIITIASDAARIGSAGEAVYSAAKGGVISFTKSLARELARHNVTVNCVSPGPTDTPMLRAVTSGDEAMLEKLVRATPLRRLGTPKDVASAVLFLASDDASHITGQVLSVSGGITMV
jgi:2-hydroxycyclohexanecarboxyl-CoA dehydrogenase